jgi:hypothetical protein
VTRADPSALARPADERDEGEIGDAGWEPPHEAPITAALSATNIRAAMDRGRFNDIG